MCVISDWTKARREIAEGITHSRREMEYDRKIYSNIRQMWLTHAPLKPTLTNLRRVWRRLKAAGEQRKANYVLAGIKKILGGV